MPSHTINKLLTPPDFLEHTPVPHVERKLLMHAAKHQTSSMLWSPWLITVSKRPDMLTRIWFNLLRSLWKYGLTSRNIHSQSWRHGETLLGKLTGMNVALLFQLTKGETRTGVVCPFLTTGISIGTMEKLMHWKGVAVKAYYFGESVLVI